MSGSTITPAAPIVGSEDAGTNAISNQAMATIRR